MVLARVTFQPSVVYDMELSEFNSLLASHLIYVDWRDLYVNWLVYSDGPPAAVAAVSIQIKNAALDVVLATTSSGVIQVGAGAYIYRWANAGIPAPGTYSILWSALDADGITCTATDTVTV